MIINIKDLKNKIIYRANYRGTKEMDKLLGSFAKIYINQLKEDELPLLCNLLDIDDENLTSNNSSIGLSESVLNSSRHNSFNDSIVSSKRTSEISTASPNFRFNKFNLSPRYR